MFDSVAETLAETVKIICLSDETTILNETQKKSMLGEMKSVALDLAKTKQEFDIKSKALNYVEQKLNQVPDLEIDKVILLLIYLLNFSKNLDNNIFRSLIKHFKVTRNLLRKLMGSLQWTVMYLRKSMKY